MLFQETWSNPHITQIMCGDKTETRRRGKKWVMKKNHIYPVHNAANGLFQKREDAICQIECTARWEERLRDLTEESACREGLYTIDDFLKVWKEIYGSINLNQVVRVYRFEEMKK